MKRFTSIALAISCPIIVAFGDLCLAEDLSSDQIKQAFEKSSLSLSDSEAARVKPQVQQALEDSCANRGRGNSKVSFSAVQIAQELGINTKIDPTVVKRITDSIESLPCRGEIVRRPTPPITPPPPEESEDWDRYFNETISLNSNQDFLRVVGEKGFSPVHISWEDIGRYKNSVWGDRISDVGIWVRQNEHNLSSAKLALSVRRDTNFRDKIMVVPIENIKIHQSKNGSTRELTLKERLRELELTSEKHDKNVIVSNQFAVVPVPKSRPYLPPRPIPYPCDTKSFGENCWHDEKIRRPPFYPARAAFNFSIFPYGSTNYVITDVIEGSSEAIVGAGQHQLLYYNLDGEKAPFTASRAEERQDLLKLEADLKSQGMDVDVQRYYLIQIPLKRETSGIQLSNMGTPPFHYQQPYANFQGSTGAMSAPMMLEESVSPKSDTIRRREAPGLSKVAIGHGDPEGPYSGGSGYQSKRADEPIRVTVVYFVTPIGKVTREDMENFAKTFSSWDDKAIWGGSFVTDEQ